MEEKQIKKEMELLGISLESTPQFPIILSTIHKNQRISIRYVDMTLEESFEHFKEEFGLK